MLNDLRYAARMLRRAPGFTLLAVLALALGIGANCAIFSVVHALLLAPLPYTDPAHLYEIASTDPKQAASLADFAALKETSSRVSQVAVHRFWSFTLRDHWGDAERIYGRALSTGMIPLLGVTPQLGRAFQPKDYRPGAPRVVLLSHRLWMRRYAGDLTRYRSSYQPKLGVSDQPGLVVDGLKGEDLRGGIALWGFPEEEAYFSGLGTIAATSLSLRSI
jgi:hypothetical protein